MRRLIAAAAAGLTAIGGVAVSATSASAEVQSFEGTFDVGSVPEWAQNNGNCPTSLLSPYDPDDPANEFIEVAADANRGGNCPSVTLQSTDTATGEGRAATVVAPPGSKRALVRTPLTDVDEGDTLWVQADVKYSNIWPEGEDWTWLSPFSIFTSDSGSFVTHLSRAGGSGGDLVFEMRDGYNDSQGIPYTVAPDEWTEITYRILFDSTAGEREVFVNGESVGTYEGQTYWGAPRYSVRTGIYQDTATSHERTAIWDNVNYGPTAESIGFGAAPTPDPTTTTPAPEPTTTTPAPEPTTTAPSGDLAFSADAESGDAASEWCRVHSGVTEGVGAVAENPRLGDYAFKSIVRDGAIIYDSERSEFSNGPAEECAAQGWHVFEAGTETYTAVSVNPEVLPDYDGWSLVTQFKEPHGGQPPTSITIDDRVVDGVSEEWYALRTNYDADTAKHWIAPVAEGAYTDLVVRHVWSPVEDGGEIEAWANGELVLPATAARTMENSNDLFLSVGHYRDMANSGEAVIFTDEVKVGSSLADVAINPDTLPGQEPTPTEPEPEPTNGPDCDRFTDSKSAGPIHCRNIEAIADLGIVIGYDDGTFKPHDPISRAEAATMFTRLIERFHPEALAE